MVIAPYPFCEAAPWNLKCDNSIYLILSFFCNNYFEIKHISNRFQPAFLAGHPKASITLVTTYIEEKKCNPYICHRSSAGKPEPFLSALTNSPNPSLHPLHKPSENLLKISILMVSCALCEKILISIGYEKHKGVKKYSEENPNVQSLLGYLLWITLKWSMQKGTIFYLIVDIVHSLHILKILLLECFGVFWKAVKQV